MVISLIPNILFVIYNIIFFLKISLFFLKSFFAWCSFCRVIQSATMSISEGFTENAPYPFCHEIPNTKTQLTELVIARHEAKHSNLHYEVLANEASPCEARSKAIFNFVISLFVRKKKSFRSPCKRSQSLRGKKQSNP